MECKRLSVIAFAIIAVSGVCMSDVLVDDPTTLGLWHMNTISSNSTPDDTSVTGRPANTLSTDDGNAIPTITSGIYGNAMDLGTTGKVVCRAGRDFPTGSNEFKLDGWFYIPNVAALPLPTADGGSGAATMYVFTITNTGFSSTTLNMYVHTDGTLKITYRYSNSTSQTCSVALYNVSTGLNLTGRWLHIITYSQYDAGAADPDYNRAVLTVIDGTTVYENVKTPSGQLLQTASKGIFVGGGVLDKTPYRGFRGKIDELKICNIVNLPRNAQVPSPTNGSTGYTYSPILSWTPGEGACRSEVYFGTNSANVAAAQKLAGDVNGDRMVDIFDVNEVFTQWLDGPHCPTCPDLDYNDVVNLSDFALMAADYNDVSTPLFLGGTTGNSFDAGEMVPNTTYYWRVDSVDCNGIVPGTVWSFTTASAKAGVPVPANNATGVTYAIDKAALSWAKGFAGDSYKVYFGNAPGSLVWIGDTSGNTMSSSVVQQNTQYYWRVDAISGGSTITGDVWTFKTGVVSFLGAEGFGRWAKGGRGGDVYHVTSLARTGTGTLRDAIDTASGPRTIVFDVTGYIDIHGTFGINKSNLTIAGQTSPGGIGISGDVVNITGCSNVIMRHMRLRHGDREWGSDCMDITSSASNIMLDHLSMQYSTDENWSIDNPQNVTLQWSINAWGLQDHSCGGLVYSKGLTVHHTLWAHNHTRNPKHRNGLMDWVNNVVFDWDIPFICADADSDTHWSNVVNSYFISAGGSTSVFTSAQSDRNTGLPTYHMYLYNTLTDLNNNGVLDGIDRGTSLNSNIDYRPTRYDAPQVTTDNPTLAYKRIVSNCGATMPMRDDVDAILMNDLTTQYRRIISSETATGASNAGMGTFGTGTVQTDTDQDGMPDYWEIAMGSSTTTADNNGDADGDGYTNLEVYLNWLAVPHTQVTAGGYVDIDLRAFTGGFAVTATYTIAGANGGTAVILGDGHTARFTSTAGAGLASFSYTVNDGSSFADSVQVLVMPGGDLTPDPMTWAIGPAAAGIQSITMTASTATAPSGVEYYFTCTAGGGHDSGWISSANYTDTGLLPGTSYTYTAKARDKGNIANETQPSVPMSATTNVGPSLPSPRAYWMLDETSGTTAADSSGNGNTGTVTGTPTWTAGIFNNCLTFNGTNTILTVPSSATIDFGDQDMTVSFWLKAPTSITASTQQEVLIKGTITTPGSGKRYEFYRKNDGTNDNFRFAIDDNVTKSEITSVSSNFCTGGWVHVVAVRDTVNNQIRLYANASLKISGTDSTGSISQTEPLTISDATNLFSGSMDDVRIYGSALTADQIYMIYLGY